MEHFQKWQLLIIASINRIILWCRTKLHPFFSYIPTNWFRSFNTSNNGIHSRFSFILTNSEHSVTNSNHKIEDIAKYRLMMGCFKVINPTSLKIRKLTQRVSSYIAAYRFPSKRSPMTVRENRKCAVDAGCVQEFDSYKEMQESIILIGICFFVLLHSPYFRTSNHERATILSRNVRKCIRSTTSATSHRISLFLSPKIKTSYVKLHRMFRTLFYLDFILFVSKSWCSRSPARSVEDASEPIWPRTHF